MANPNQDKQFSSPKWILGLCSGLAFMALPHVAMGQTIQTTPEMEARAAELMCEVGGICGDLAVSENARAQETKDGVKSRGLMKSIATVNSAIPKGSTSETISSGTSIVREPVPNSNKVASAAPVGSISPTQQPITIQSSTGNGFQIVQSVTSPLRAQLMVNFALGSDQLTEGSEFEVLSFAAAVRNMEDIGHVKKYRIEGHADSTGSEAINLPLSDRRAAAVRNMLINQGGLDSTRIEFVGFGSKEPLSGLQSDDPLNRRVEAVLVD